MVELRRMDDERIVKLEERVSNWMAGTSQYREDLCKKLDKIQMAIDKLPCEGRCEETKSIHENIGWLQKIMWTVICFGVPSLLGLAVAWGSISITVTRNTDIIERLEETSYGFRGIKVVTHDELSKEANLGMHKL